MRNSYNSSEDSNQYNEKQRQQDHYQNIYQQISNNEQEQNQDQIDYADVFQQARREQVLRNLHEDYNINSIPEQEHEQVMQILQRRNKKEQYNQEKKKKDEMKRLRQQNALEFFRKVKLQLLVNIRDSIYQAKSAQKYKQDKIHKFISCFSIDSLKLLQFIMAKPQNLRSRKQFIQLLIKIFNESNIQLEQHVKYQAIWALGIYLGIGFRKIAFFDISQMDLQSFYNLKYQSTKGKKKKISKQIDILKNKLQRKVTEQQLKDQKFVSIQQYSFNPAKMHSQTQSQSQKDSSKIQEQFSNAVKRAQVLKQIKRPLKKVIAKFTALYKIIGLFTQQINQMKNTILDNKAIIGFYSIRIMQFLSKYKQLKKHRLLDNIQIRDQTVDFCDRYQQIMKRIHRLGCKTLYKTLMREYNTFKTMEIFTSFQRMLIEKEKNKEIQWAKSNFPKSVKQMRISDYFVTPSLVQKYMILKEDAKPIPNIQFHQEKVYYKTDLQRVSSRMGWVDQNRMVKLGQIPLKTTQNKNKTTTKLFKHNQTQPFYLKIDENGDFVLDQQYNSIYVPPTFQVPQGYALIKQNIQYLCKRNKFKCSRIVQGFTMGGGHLIPNNIGYIVQLKHKEEILKIYQQRQQKLKLKKQSRKLQNSMALWRKLFKSIIITQQVYQS